MKKPNFFIVGAPKCGTSSLFDYLKQHPDIYGATVKEPCYFGSDLDRKAINVYDDLSEYEKLYEGADRETCVGEASTWYLYSTSAAEEIKSIYPDSKIIIMLRNPVDLMHSLHGQLLKTGDETIKSFSDALYMEDSRKHGENIPETVSIVQSLFYRDVVKFSSQIQRYFITFGEDRCKIILFEDFISDTASVYKSTLRFLCVDDQFEATINIVNQGKQIKSLWLHQAIISPGFIQKLVKNTLPATVRKKIGDIVHGINTANRGRSALDEELIEKLAEECREDIVKLEKLLGIDLARWYGK